MEHDDDLTRFEATGVEPLPTPSHQGYVDHDGAKIWSASFGSGRPVILLHGGLGHSGNWAAKSQPCSPPGTKRS